MIALPGGLDEYPFREKETILICGRQPEVIRAALEMGVSCIILCQAGTAGGSAGQGRRYLHYCDSL